MTATACEPIARVSLVAGPRRATRAERIGLAIAGAAAVFVLAIAFSLAPDARGYGTHERLGLPPCGLMLWTGVPCPSCGMTTSFSRAVRLDVGGAARAQPLGLVLALATAATALGAPIAAARALPVVPLLMPISRRTGLTIIGSIVAAWAYKVLAVLVFGGGP